MILTAHILTGAVAGAKTQNLALGMLFAFLSHLLIDTIPHSDYSFENIKRRDWKNSKPDFLKVFLDIFFGFLAIAIISITRGTLFDWRILLGGFFGILPDGLTFLKFIFPKNKLLSKFYLLHQKTHIFERLKGNKKLSFGRIFSQVFIFIAMVYLLLGL